ncbi:MAG: hypothetical protein ACMUHY_08665 [Thermoplasmatota archaeon]
MEHSIVTLLGPDEWTRSVGKETSSTSFGIGVLKRDDRIVTTVYPSKYPEKIWSLLFTLSLSDRIYLNIERIDRNLGEIIIALDLLRKEEGHIHVNPMVDISMIDSILKGTVVEEYADFDPDQASLREVLMDTPRQEVTEGCDLVVDQAFNVKGVGCVALGFVVRGTVSRHQHLSAYPGNSTAIVRSIQVHDRDQTEAPSGARVGLALKNVDTDDLPRGTLLTSGKEGLHCSDQMKGRFMLSEYWKEEISEGARFHLWNSLQFTPVELRNIRFSDREEREFSCDLHLESRVWVRTGDMLGLTFLDSKSFRLFASGESI